MNRNDGLNLSVGRTGNIQSNLLYFLIGGGIGAATALLFAPKAGKELRQDASEAVKYGLETTNKTVSHLKETADGYYQKAQDKASNLYQVAVKTVNEGIKQTKSIADDVVDKAQQISNGAEALSDERNPPLYGDENTPFDQRDSKAGVL